MAELTTIARPYAEAVARLAKDGKTWAAWSDMLNLITAVTTDPAVAALASNPAVSGDKVAELILSVCQDRLTPEGVNFVRLLVEGKRLSALPEIARLYEEAKSAQEGQLEARIVTAYEMSQTQMVGMVAALEKKFGQKINATQEVDANLIGGVLITVGDEVLDASVRGKLADLAVTLNG